VREQINTAQQYRSSSAFFPKLAIVALFGLLTSAFITDGSWLAAGFTFLLGVSTWGNA
jgi:hypothetical protein